MKSIALALALIVASQTANAADLQKWQSDTLKLVKAEKTVIDARWRDPEANVLWVSMKPNAGRRDGFAEYLCMLLMSNGAPEGDLKTVWIYDPVTYEDAGTAMGLAACR